MHLRDILNAQIERVVERFAPEPKTFVPELPRRGINVLETGTIRNADPVYANDDGWSTLHFAAHAGVRHVTSVDLDTHVARLVLEMSDYLDKVTLVEDHSVSAMGMMLARTEVSGHTFHLAFLDSDNDPTLILCEYLLAKTLLVPGGIILIDDVDMREGADARKGHAVVPWLRQHAIPYEIVERRGTNISTGVLITEVP